MGRSRTYWRAMLHRVFAGERDKPLDYSRSESWILAVFGLASFVYTAGLRVFIVCYAGAYLIDWFQFPGLLLAAGLAVFYARQSVTPLVSAAASLFKRLENVMAKNEESTSTDMNSNTTRRALWRRRLPALGLSLFIVALLLTPQNRTIFLKV